MMTFVMIHNSGRRGTELNGAIFAKQVISHVCGWGGARVVSFYLRLFDEICVFQPFLKNKPIC